MRVGLVSLYLLNFNGTRFDSLSGYLRYIQQLLFFKFLWSRKRSGFESQYALGGVWCNGSKKEKYLVKFPILFNIAG